MKMNKEFDIKIRNRNYKLKIIEDKAYNGLSYYLIVYNKELINKFNTDFKKDIMYYLKEEIDEDLFISSNNNIILNLGVIEEVEEVEEEELKEIINSLIIEIDDILYSTDECYNMFHEFKKIIED